MQQLAEGTMRRNKRTGEVQVLQGGQWVSQGGAQQLPLVIEGPPREPPPQTPVDAQRDQVGLNRDQIALERERIELEKTRAGTEEKKAGVEQGKAAGFYSRAVKADNIYSGLGVGAPSLARAAAQEALPPALVNQFTDPQRQQSEAAQEEFVKASLRYESGAAIPPEELLSQVRTYFPVPGDSQETIELKAQLRKNVIDALKIGAGDAAPDLSGLTDETVRQQLEQRIARGDTPQNTVKWLAAIGRPPTPEQVDRIFANANNPDPRVLPPEDGINVNLENAAHGFGVGLRGVAQGVGDAANLVSTPFIQGANAVLGTDFNPDMGANLGDMLGLPQPETGAERAAFAVNRGGTAALGFAGAARAAAPFAAGATQNALARFGSAPLTDMTAGAGAMGASELTRQAGGGPLLQTAVGLAGGAAAIPVSSRVNALMSPMPRATPPVVRAGQQEGVTVNRAMVDPEATQRVTAVGKTMVGGRRMQRDMARVGGEIEGRVQRLGQGGEALDPNVAGQAVERIGERAIETSGKEAKRLYDRAEKASAGIKVPPRNSVAIVDEMIAKLSEMPNDNANELSYLTGLKADLGKDLSVGALRDLRTRLRKKISKGELTFGQNEKRVLEIMEAAADDIADGLVAQGKRGAAQMFRRADRLYAERMDFVKNTVQKIIGKRDQHFPPEKIIANLRAMASPKGDVAGLAKMMRSMEPDERADIAATFVDALGKNADGEFSTAFFVKHVEKLPRAARAAIFGPEGARSLDNLSVLAKEHKRVTRALGGSPTGTANDYRSFLLNLVFGGGAGIGTGSPATGAAVAAGGLAIKAGRDFLNARLLMSPNIQKWLRSAPRTADPKAINSHFDRLKAIAAREPVLGPEIESLQQMIMRTANENAVSRASASGGQQPESEQ